MTPDHSCPKVAFLPANIDACALVRMFIPHLHTPKSKFLFKADKLDIKTIEGSEVIAVQRQITPANLGAMKLLRKEGYKIVYDSDDNLWSLPSYNPAKRAFEAMQEGFSLCVKEAHVVTVSTQGLKTALQTQEPKLTAEILVVPNAVDFNLLQPTQLTRNDGKIIIGWGGSNTHSGDLEEAISVLPDVVRNHENVHVQFIGMVPDQMRGVPRVSFRGWVPVGEWCNRFPNFAWDIALAPLQDNRFNHSKSNLKMLESAAARIPCLASDVKPYHEFCALGGKDLEWLLCRFTSDWKKKLERLINDPLYRNYLGDLMYQTAKKHYDIEVIKNNWAYAFRQAMAA